MARWWMWPSLLAIDAPIVGLAWLFAFGADAGRAPTASAAMLVGLSIWLVYVGDRLVDSLRMARETAGSVDGRAGRPITDRHAFALDARAPLASLWAAVLAVAAIVAVRTLSAASWWAGLGVVAIAAVTFAPGLRRSRAGYVVRALLVGLAFAGAIGVGLAWDLDAGTIAALAAFALVCAANVAFVSAWERTLWDGSAGRGGSESAAFALAAVAVATATLTAAAHPTASSGVVAAACLLMLVHALRHDLGARQVRVVADAALVVPLGVSALLRLFG